MRVDSWAQRTLYALLCLKGTSCFSLLKLPCVPSGLMLSCSTGGWVSLWDHGCVLYCYIGASSTLLSPPPKSPKVWVTWAWLLIQIFEVSAAWPGFACRAFASNISLNWPPAHPPPRTQTIFSEEHHVKGDMYKNDINRMLNISPGNSSTGHHISWLLA